jgi:hypothetical protein
MHGLSHRAYRSNRLEGIGDAYPDLLCCPYRRAGDRRETDGKAGAWCASYDPSTNCGFRTYQQCLMTIGGIGGFCRPNSFEPQHWTHRPCYRWRHR